MDAALRLAVLNEGYRQFPYTDTVGKITIGCGRNLTDVGLSRDEAEALCHADLEAAGVALSALDPWTDTLDPVRRAAFVDLVFNMGIRTWRTFVNTRTAGADGDWSAVVSGLQHSRWWQQVGHRGPRIAWMIATGLWPWDEGGPDA